jgi:hypothetical protein
LCFSVPSFYTTCDTNSKNHQPVRLADGWCWFVLREKYWWLVAGGWFVLREKVLLAGG